MAKSPTLMVHVTCVRPKNLAQMAEIFDGIKSLTDQHLIDPERVTIYNVEYGEVKKLEFYWTTPATV